MKKGFLRRLMLLALFCLSAAGVFLLQEKTVYATATPTPAPAGAVRVVAVEYYDEQIVVKNNGNKKICFATEVEAAKDNWEVINADSGTYTWIDISWLSTTVENILVIKGADDPTSTKARVIIKDKPTKLEVNINYEKLDTIAATASIAPLVNIMTSVGTGSDPVAFDDLEWRKGTSGQWQSTKTLKAGTIDKFLVKGTYLYFRIRAVDDVVTTTSSGGTVYNFDQRRYDGLGGFSSIADTGETLGTDYPIGTEGRRFSNEIKVKVAKKATALVYGIDGEEFTAAIKYGKEYRVTYGSVVSGWIQVTDRATKTIPLSTIIGKVITTTPVPDGSIDTKAFPTMKIEVRDYATSKAASSKITEIYLNAQRKITTAIITGEAPANAILTGDKNIYIYYNGNKNIVLEIPSATPENPYEYCVVKGGQAYDVTKVVWAAVTKGTEVKILSSKAVEGGTIYIRQKEIKSKEATDTSAAIDYALASTYVSQLINYPSIPEITDASYTFTKAGYSGDISFTATLNEAGKDPFETVVKSIKLGTKDIDFTTSTTTVTTSKGDVKTMTITLKATSLATMTNCYSKAITITYNKGTIDKTSVKLTIQTPVASSPLTLSNAKGTNTASTAFAMVSSKATTSTWAYVITDTEIKDVNTLDKVSKFTTVTPTAFTALTVDNIAITANQYLTVFELDASGYILKYRCVKITTDYIK